MYFLLSKIKSILSSGGLKVTTCISDFYFFQHSETVLFLSCNQLNEPINLFSIKNFNIGTKYHRVVPKTAQLYNLSQYDTQRRRVRTIRRLRKRRSNVEPCATHCHS